MERALESDVEAIRPLLAAQLTEHGVGMDDDSLRAAILGLVGHPDRGAILVARMGGEVVGIAVMPFTWTVEHGGQVAWLDELYVRPDRRGAGIGTKLLKVAIAAARSEGLRALDLEVDAEHARVVPLYLRHGFRALSRERFVMDLRD